MRHWQILGPLAQHSPLATPLEKLFSREPMQRAPWVVNSWRVLRGISSLATPARLDSAVVLRAGTLLGDQYDYFLSPLTLLILGRISALEGNYQAAIVTLQDATLLAAQFEQHGMLAESLGLLSACSAASGRADLTEPLQQASAWCAKRSSLSQVAGLLGAAELSIYGGNLELTDKLLKQNAVVLRSREIALPRQQAQQSFVSSMLAFGQNRGTLGISNLDAALKRMRGSSQTGAVVAPIFQAQMTLDLLAGGALSAGDAEAILDQVLAEPGASSWQLAPLETIATITTSSIPAYRRLLELSARRGTPEQVLQRVDRLQRQRLFEAFPLGGRLFGWRMAASADPQTLPPQIRAMVGKTLQQFPALQSTSKQIEALVARLRKAPLPLNDRQLPSEAKKNYAELEELSKSYESQLAFQSLLRKPLDRYVPLAATVPTLQKTLAEGDLALGFVYASEQIFSVAVTQDAVEVWQIPELEAINSRLGMLLVEIGLVRQQAGQLPSAVTASNAPWRDSARQLLTLLFPPNVRQLIDQSKRILIAPGGRLWYLPFELLPLNDQPGALPWIATHRIAYVPTLGSLPFAFSPKPAVTDTVGVYGGFFSIDKESNRQQAEALIQAIPGAHGVSLLQKVTVPSSLWLRIRTDQLLVVSKTDAGGNGWDTRVLPLDNTRQTQIGTWLETPGNSSARVLLPGLNTSMRSGQLQNGNELFLPACALLYGGTRTALLSRWAAGGRSAGTALTRYIEELEDEPSSEAWRRAALSQWTEQFLIADEPILLPAGKEASALSSGQHPLLWSGYMAIGDTFEPPAQ